MKRALVIGAGGALGESAARLLLAGGWRVRASVRDMQSKPAKRLAALGAELIALDLNAAWPEGAADDVDAAILTPILSLSIRAVPYLLHVKRIVAFSSNNVGVDSDAPTYRALASAEARLRQAKPEAIILRPTLIYGDARLSTVPRLMRFARRFHVLPLPGSGRALTQPVFFDDLGRAAATLAGDQTPGGAYALGGPDVVTMLEFYQAIVQAAGAKCAIAPIPVWALKAAHSVLGERMPLDSVQIARAERDRLANAPDATLEHIAPRTRLEEGLRQLSAHLV